MERKVVLSKEIKRVIPAGMFAQAMLCTLCPEKIISVVKGIEDDEIEQYEKTGVKEVHELPETGKMYGAPGNTGIWRGSFYD